MSFAPPICCVSFCSAARSHINFSNSNQFLLVVGVFLRADTLARSLAFFACFGSEVVNTLEQQWVAVHTQFSLVSFLLHFFSSFALDESFDVRLIKNRIFRRKILRSFFLAIIARTFFFVERSRAYQYPRCIIFKFICQRFQVDFQKKSYTDVFIAADKDLSAGTDGKK